MCKIVLHTFDVVCLDMPNFGINFCTDFKSIDERITLRKCLAANFAVFFCEKELLH